MKYVFSLIPLFAIVPFAIVPIAFARQTDILAPIDEHHAVNPNLYHTSSDASSHGSTRTSFTEPESAEEAARRAKFKKQIAELKQVSAPAGVGFRRQADAMVAQKMDVRRNPSKTRGSGGQTRTEAGAKRGRGRWGFGRRRSGESAQV